MNRSSSLSSKTRKQTSESKACKDGNVFYKTWYNCNLRWQIMPKAIKLLLLKNHGTVGIEVLAKLYLQWLISHIFRLRSRHLIVTISMKLLQSGTVERNPGPSRSRESSVAVTTYNVRGLKDEGKLRHLLNYCHQGANSTELDCIHFFQETYIEKPGKIPYIWRGNFFLTAGEGQSGGCLTLLSHHLNILSS